jgi:hypothetical protein
MRGNLCILFLALGCVFAADPSTGETVTGKLVVTAGKPAALETAGHKLLLLDGDESTRKILADQRLNGFEVQARGHATSTGGFLLDPIHTSALMVVKDGKLKRITYWCETCHLRAFTPGICVCCQGETDLDLIDPDASD